MCILYFKGELRIYLFSILDRNEAGILTARKDLDHIGREELLEALKRVSTYLPAATPSILQEIRYSNFSL